MKLPAQIVGRNKIRDCKICNLYLEEGLTPSEIEATGKFKIRTRQIRNILYKNRILLKYDKDWENTKQIHRAKRQIAKKKESKKDPLDWENHLSELLSDKKLKVEHFGEVKTGEDKIIIIRPQTKKEEPIEDRTQAFPR